MHGRSRRLLRALALLSVMALGACRGEVGDPCSLASDCRSGLLCHPDLAVCVAVDCGSDGECTIEPPPGAPTPDAGPSDRGGVKNPDPGVAGDRRDDQGAPGQDPGPSVDADTIGDTPSADDGVAEDAQPDVHDGDQGAPDAGDATGADAPPPACDPALDSDGDGLDDCTERDDPHPFTVATAFNGLTATIGEAPKGFFTSAECDRFFGGDLAAMSALFADSTQRQDLWAGWAYEAGNTAEYDRSEFGAQPQWTHHGRVGIWNSFQIRFEGQFFAAEAGRYCFSVDTGAGGLGPGDIAGRRNSCGRVFLNAGPSDGPLAETGYGSAASPHTGCADLEAGVHALVLAARHYQASLYAPKLQFRWCYDAAGDCTPEAPLERTVLRSLGASSEVCVPDCEGRECGPDGCGGTCGACADPTTACDAAGRCTLCTPACEGKACGPDGCGRSCGSCPDGEQCADDGTCAAPTGACTNPADQAIVDGLGPDGLEREITSCGAPCVFGTGDKAQCVIDCMVDNIGLSRACAGCFGLVTGCALEHCAFTCVNAGAACDTCMADNRCQEGFPACSGLPE